jgi:hypothetical protein
MVKMKWTKSNYFILGLVLVCLWSLLPFGYLRGDSLFTIHDQLDGEILSYILAARHWGEHLSVYPELMNGLPVTGQIPPALSFVLFYRYFPALEAMTFSLVLIRGVAFAGMFLLLCELFQDRHVWVYFLVGCLFALLPYYPVYGLCIPGQPFLAFTILMGCRRKRWIPVAGVTAVLYGVSSSLVLVGFAVCFAILVFTIREFRHKNRKGVTTALVALGTLTLTYVLTNLSLFAQVLHRDKAFVSHKSEYVLNGLPFLGSLKDVLGDGISYTQTFAQPLLIVTMWAAGLLIWYQYRHIKKRRVRILIYADLKTAFWMSLWSIVAISLWYCIYHSGFVCNLRNRSTGVFHEMNLDRFVWLMPLCWCILAVSSVELLFIFRDYLGRKKKLIRWGYAALLVVLGLWWTGTVLWHTEEKYNYSKILKGRETYHALDWDGFWAEDLFSQIKASIGKNPEDYRVVSLGIFPSVSVYNGLYALDAYTNNYDVNYKHRFREAIAPELARDEYIQHYFDDWGNRCYLFTKEQSNYFTVEKTEDRKLKDLQIDFSALAKMGCNYLISASPVENCEELGLTEIGGSPFESQNSWYRLYVYELTGFGA